MEEASFFLVGYHFIEASLNFNDVPVNAKINLNFEPSGIYVQETSVYNLKFIFNAFIKNGEKEIPVIKVVCVASYKFNDKISFDDLPSYFFANSIAILFPYIRAFVSTMTLQANINPIILPIINLSSLQDDLKKNTIVR